MKNKKRIIHKITILGGLLLGVPLMVFLLLLSVVLWRIGSMHRDYSQVVAALQRDLDLVDQNILKQNAGINQHQEKTRELNRQITEEFFQQQLDFSAMEVLVLIASEPQVVYPVPAGRIFAAYLNKTRLSLPVSQEPAGPEPTGAEPAGAAPVAPAMIPEPAGAMAPAMVPAPAGAKAPAMVPAPAGAMAPAPAAAAQVAPAPLTPSVPRETSRVQGSEAAFNEQLRRWLEEHDYSKVPKITEVMERFVRNSNLGFENRELILVAHSGLHQHRIIWSTEPQYISQQFSKIMRTLHQLFISENYMKSFLQFQKGEIPVRLLFQFEYADEIGYSDAKYNLSKQRYFGLIPLLGTNLSLGVRTPLTHEFIQVIDNIGHDLNKIGTGLGKSDSDIRAADGALASLTRRFHSSNSGFRKLFMLTLLLATFFILLTSALAIRSLQRGFVRPVLQMQEVARKIEEGKLDERIRVNTGDELQELSDSINAMLDRTVILIRSDEERQRVQQDIFALLDVVSRASSGDLTVRGTVSTDELQAIVDAFNHMMNSIGVLVIKVRNAGVQVEQMSRKLLEYSRRILEKSQKQIQDLDIASRKIKALGDRSQEITRMVEQIGTIALETNTLALNASLEAARSGKHDAGIGHLAEHVRQLADGLNKTKQDIESFIGSIQLATNYAVTSVEEVLHMSQQTTAEAEQSYRTAEFTSAEAGQLGEAISRFKVRTIEDKEREQRIFRELSFVAFSLSEIRKTLREMDSNEYENLHAALSSFATELKGLGVEEHAFELPGDTGGAQVEVPAILPDQKEGE
jgi:methyl-accepting chemotaxis protein